MLEAQGFTVKGEVKGCDIAAVKDGELWIIEMKKNFGVNLLYQAMSRQAITPYVFVAIPRPKRISKDFRMVQKLLKKLEIGLITVSLDTSYTRAEIILFPKLQKKAGLNKRAAVLKKEIAGRSFDTPGGVNKMPVLTAYRERCIKTACLLEKAGTASPKDLVKIYGADKDAGRILWGNMYGWFDKISKGVYSLSPKGKEFLDKSSGEDVIIFYRNQPPLN